ncbi:MAG: hypothetical protein H9W81_02585, partial [Enterococcus sp.]|nr:hypothetical protein [Enterococcus sp.]
MKNKQVIVFPANGDDVTTVHPNFAHEAKSVREIGGEIVILDMEKMATGKVIASGILDDKMAREYDHCEITEDDIADYLEANNLESVAYDRRCYFRLPGPVSIDFYQL